MEVTSADAHHSAVHVMQYSACKYSRHQHLTQQRLHGENGSSPVIIETIFEDVNGISLHYLIR